MDRLDFKQAGISDIELIQKLANEIWNISYKEMLSKEQIDYMLQWMYSSDAIKKEMHEGVIWELIVFNEITIGYISLTAEEKKLKLNKLYLLPHIQSKGLGQTALNHVIEYARKMKFESVYLTVNQRNYRAIKAYEKAKFKRKEFKIFDIGGGYVMDDFIYEYDLV